MATYKFAEPAIDDVESLIRYTIGKWGKRQAEAYFSGLERQAQMLAEMPALGKPVFDGLRVFPYKSHALYFLKEHHGITIARILHESMLPALHLDDMARSVERRKGDER